MIQVRKDLCLGCGLCVDSCPQQAISLFEGHAVIDQSRCNQCRLCFEVCPQEAIVEMVPISKRELQTTVASLRQKTKDLIEKIERLQRQEGGQVDAADRSWDR